MSNCITFSPDGHWIACGFSDSKIRVANSDTGNVTGFFEGYTDSVTSTAFSPNGEQIASGSSDQTVRIWDFKTRAQIVGPILGHTGPIGCVTFSPDGQTLASGSADKTVRIWDSTTGLQMLQSLEGHTDSVLTVAFSPDGTRIWSRSADKTTRVWDARTGTVVAGPFEHHTGDFVSVAFSPDGKRMVSASRDYTIRVWEVRFSFMSLSHISDLRQVEKSQDTWGKHPHFIDGWLMNSASEHVLWVPHHLRNGLCPPWNSLAISTYGETKLDLSRFVHGTDWLKCSKENGELRETS
jgi:WD40 repeat protein